jgi:hypothetical protein
MCMLLIYVYVFVAQLCTGPQTADDRYTYCCLCTGRISKKIDGSPFNDGRAHHKCIIKYRKDNNLVQHHHLSALDTIPTSSPSLRKRKNDETNNNNNMNNEIDKLIAKSLEKKMTEGRPSLLNNKRITNTH